MLRASSLDDFATSFKSGYKRHFRSSIGSSDSESVRGVDGRCDDFDKELIRPRLGDIEVSEDRDGSESLDNQGFLGFFFH
jgi:hypothetical protein